MYAFWTLEMWFICKNFWQMLLVAGTKLWFMFVQNIKTLSNICVDCAEWGGWACPWWKYFLQRHWSLMKSSDTKTVYRLQIGVASDPPAGLGSVLVWERRIQIRDQLWQETFLLAYASVQPNAIFFHRWPVTTCQAAS